MLGTYDRLMARIVMGPNGCWVCTGANIRGYGIITHGRKGESRLAHRFMYAHVNGSIPHGLYVLHRCDNPRCVRPDHLYAGTQLENMRDVVERGRHGNRLRKRPFCHLGHPLSGENLLLRKHPDGRDRRDCLTCHKARTRKTIEKRSAVRRARREAAVC